MSTFFAAVPLGGLAGWSLLQRTAPEQRQAFANSPVPARDAEYFRQAIGKISSAEELVADRRLLSVALSAFGLEDDLPNKAFIQQVLESDPLDQSALANKLADARYGALASAFGFGSGFPRNQIYGFAEPIIAQFMDRGFEASVGAQQPDLRLALSLERELDTVLADTEGEDARWFAIMASPPLREIFEGALGMPESIGALDLDRQLLEFRSKSAAIFGAAEVGDFADEGLSDQLRRRYLLQSQQGIVQVQNAAVQILSGGANTQSLLGTLYGI